MAVDTKPARERRGTTLSLREQQGLGNSSPSSFASRTGPGGLLHRAAPVHPSSRRNDGPGSHAWPCWELGSPDSPPHVVTRSDGLPAGLTLHAFGYRAVAPTWQSLSWFRYGLKPANPKLYPLLSFTEPFPIHLGGKQQKQALGWPVSFWAGAGASLNRSYGVFTLLTRHRPGQMDIGQTGVCKGLVGVHHAM